MQIENQEQHDEGRSTEILTYACRVHQDGHLSQEEADSCIAASTAGIPVPTSPKDETGETEDRQRSNTKHQDRGPNRPQAPQARLTQAKGGERLIEHAQEARRIQELQQWSLVSKVLSAVTERRITIKAANYIVDHYFDPRPEFSEARQLVRRLVGNMPDPMGQK